MIMLCEIPLCPNLRVVVVHRTDGQRLRVCVEHLLHVLEAHDGGVIAFWKVPVPCCAREACQRDALRCPPDQEGRGHFVCREHFDDLSWIDLPLDLLPDETGWSHG